MEKLRKPLQGVSNIIRFNWHFYLIALLALIALLTLSQLAGPTFQFYFHLLFFLALAATLVSLLVSLYVYDVSDLYRFNWLKHLEPMQKASILNIHAGFDETSDLLQSRFSQSELNRLDFYDPAKHTEVSIRRARKAFPQNPSTVLVNTNSLQCMDDSADLAFLIMSAHEIRNKEERVTFFKELKRVVKPLGQIIVVEHLRDLPNLLAYNFGFFHFYSNQTWKNCFRNAGFTLSKEVKITPFVSLFILEHGNSS